MCSPTAAIAGASVGMQTLSSYLGQKSTARSAQEMMNAQAKAAIREMNYNISNLEQERTDAFDHAVADISNVRLNSLQLNSGVKAAVNETMSGRTANLIVRATEGDTARAVASIQDNYDRKSNEVDLNRERAMLSTEAYLQNLNNSAPKMPSRLANFMSFAGTALNAWAGARIGGEAKTPKTTASNTTNSQWGAWGNPGIIKDYSSYKSTQFTSARRLF